jgi:hypothetical protein
MLISSVVLLEIDPIGVAVFLELKCNAPRAIYMYGVSGWLVSPQGMEPEPGDVHLLRHHSNVETVEHPKDASMELRADLGCVIVRP